MTRRCRATWPLLLFLCLLFVLIAEAQYPEVVYTSLNRAPKRLYFFEDTTSVIYIDPAWDESAVYVSHDGGKVWVEVDIPRGEAHDVTLHPFNNHYAFILTTGTKIYRTSDRGHTWQSFDLLVQSFSLSFHSDPQFFGYILYDGMKCVESGAGEGSVCHKEVYYTRDAFSSEPTLLLPNARDCRFAHSSKEFIHDEPRDLVLCITQEMSGSFSSRLVVSNDFFRLDQRTIDLGAGRNAHDVHMLLFFGKFAVLQLTDLENDGDLQIYVSLDLKNWTRARFPSKSSAYLRWANPLIASQTTHKLSIDVYFYMRDTAAGTLFVSDSNGTFFVESLDYMDWNTRWETDYQKVHGVDGVRIANVIANAKNARWDIPQQQQTRITFDDGSTWSRLVPPAQDVSGESIGCDLAYADSCSLHLHNINQYQRQPFLSTPKPIISSPAPGLVLRVGSVGPYRQLYEECDTFMSTDAGLSWMMVRKGPHKFGFADQGSVIVLIRDADDADEVLYSIDTGNSWKTLKLEYKLRPIELTTMPDPTSQKFLLTGHRMHENQIDSDTGDANVVPDSTLQESSFTGLRALGNWTDPDHGDAIVVFLDFAPTRGQKCAELDFEKWYIQDQSGSGCILGRKQWYLRRRLGRDCYVGHVFSGPEAGNTEEDCPCSATDYECDYDYHRDGGLCKLVGPEPIPANVCPDSLGTYMGSSGYRRIAGNTCDSDSSRGVIIDAPIKKDCEPTPPPEGEVAHQTFGFSSEIVQYEYLKETTTMLVRLRDGTVWQSRNEGYTWIQLFPDRRFATFVLHAYSPYRAYLLTHSKLYYYTTDAGRSWIPIYAPLPQNTFSTPALQFNPRWDYLIWTGNADCEGSVAAENCHAEAYYSTDHGQNWNLVERYVRHCAWARDEDLKRDMTQVLCESYKEKKGSQRHFNSISNSLQLVSGTEFYRNTQLLIENVVGFVRLSDYLVVLEFQEKSRLLRLQISQDGKTFVDGIFPGSFQPQNHAHTILDASSESIFLYLTTSEPPNPSWGALLKSNNNGTIFVLTAENVNRNDRGFVDFEKLPLLSGIALINIVASPEDAHITGRKELQTRITHNDGGSWEPLTPPKKNSYSQYYDCTIEKCALHLHGFSERPKSRSMLGSPTVPGLMIAVGNVGEVLAPYKEGDTFLSRDAGFTWEEVRKGSHVWAFGDRGSVLVMASDSAPTDHVLFSTDEGLSWAEYKFTSQEKVRVRSIETVPQDTSRRFILFGYYPRSMDAAVVVHLDFSSLTFRKCVLELDNPSNADFELWSPAESRQERCLFGRQKFYQRRIRDRNCYIGDQRLLEDRVVQNCDCTESDFECEFNHVRNDDGACALEPGTSLLANDTSCSSDEDIWYERTAYRKIAYSSCTGGLRLDRGAAHACTGRTPEDKNGRTHGLLFWFVVAYLSLAMAGLVGYGIFRCRGLARGKIRLSEGDSPSDSESNSSLLRTLVFVPRSIGGFLGNAWRRVKSTLPFRPRNAALDHDIQVLRLEDDDR